MRKLVASFELFHCAILTAPLNVNSRLVETAHAIDCLR